MKDIAAKLEKIAIIGGGKMGEAILAGLVHGAMFDRDLLVVAEPDSARREYLSETYEVTCVELATQVAEPDTIILSVKPQVLPQICREMVAVAGFNPKRVVSVAAGITTATLREIFTEAALIRVMPNTPLMVGAGMSVVCVSPDTPLSEGETTQELFSFMGETLLLEESQMNAVTAISGSGPAYFALFVEELVKAGEAIGLASHDALLLSVQTLYGTARYLELTEASPQELRASVTSPKGTTHAALDAFEKKGFSKVVMAAVKAAYKRAEELA